MTILELDAYSRETNNQYHVLDRFKREELIGNSTIDLGQIGSMREVS
jgi:hypothetical protein